MGLEGFGLGFEGDFLVDKPRSELVGVGGCDEQAC